VKLPSFVIHSLIVLGAAAASQASSTPVPVNVPDPDIGVATLAERAKAQRETAGQFKVFYQFQFQDKVKDRSLRAVVAVDVAHVEVEEAVPSGNRIGRPKRCRRSLPSHRLWRLNYCSRGHSHA